LGFGAVRLCAQRLVVYERCTASDTRPSELAGSAGIGLESAISKSLGKDVRQEKGRLLSCWQAV